VGDVFDDLVISGEVGVMKPDPAAFELALARVGASAEEVLFIDDFHANVEAARSMGIEAHRFRGLAPLRCWMEQFGIQMPVPEVTSLADIRAIVFDWAGVFEGSPDSSYIAAWEESLGLQSGELQAVLWDDRWRRVEMGELSMRDYCQFVATRLKLDGVEAARRFVEEFYDGDWLYPEMVAAVHSLKGRYRLALLSNAFAELDEWLSRMFDVDVYSDFDVYINSARVGLRKPDPAIFELVLDQLVVEPEHAVFLDDNLRNVDTARFLGLHTIHVVDPTSALLELEALLGHAISLDV
jgi:epoxide hydrolase-like predicted phosphatase